MRIQGRSASSTTVVVGVSLILTAGLVQPAIARADERGPSTPVAKVVDERPDAFSAQAQARLQGSRVEDLSARTETSQTFANPDGSWTTEMAAGPERVLGDDGTWRDIDLTLVEGTDGSWAPRVAPVDVEVGGGGSLEAARVTFEDGSSLGVTWPEGKLPEPTVEGGVATYAIDEVTDLVISTSSTGAKAWIRLNKAPEDLGQSFSLGLSSSGVDVVEEDGVLELRDDSGEVLGATSDLVAWDASEDAAGAPLNVVDLDVELAPVDKDSKRQAALSRRAASDSDDLVLSLALPEGYLEDPTIEYPVIIDPNISALGVTRDTWVRNGTTDVKGKDERLLVGRMGMTSAEQTISYVWWNLGSKLPGSTIISATGSLYQYEAESCSTSKATNVYQVTSTWTEGATVYTSRPDINGTAVSSWTRNVGGAGCSTSNDRVTFDLKSLVQKWANGTANYGVSLKAPPASATDLSFGKRFCSSDYASSDDACFTADRIPKLSVTFSSAPSVPSGPTFVQTGSAAGVTNVAKPVLTAKATDPFGDTVRYNIQVHTSTAATAATLKSSCTTAFGYSGVATSCTPGTALASGTYYLRAQAVNAYGLTSSWTPASSMSKMTVDLDKPSVSVASSAYANNGWLDSLPASNTFTFTSPASDVVQFRYSKDGGAASNVAAVANGTGKKATLAWNEQGGHRLTVQAIDHAGNASAATTFNFGSGGASITAPTVAGVKTTSKTTLRAGAPGPGGGSVTASAYWRVRGANAADFSDTNGTTTGWTKQNVATVTAAGAMVNATAVLDAAAIAGSLSRSRKATVIDVQVCFTYSPSGLTRCSWTKTPASHATVTYVPHAFGDRFPTAEAGPGQVALWTGEFSTSATDVSVPGYSGDLSVSRTYNTFNDGSVTGAFGPGWTPSFDGADAGVAGVEVQDDTDYDGTISLVDDEGEVLTFAQPGTGQVAQMVGAYEPLDEDTATLGATLSITSTASVKRLVFTEDDGTATTWKWDGSSKRWLVESVREPGANLSTTYEQDGQGRLVRIIAPTPPSGDKPAVTCVAGAEQPGCRVLGIVYAAASTATATTPGDIAGQVKSVTYTAYDPDKAGGAGMSTITVATYLYDASGRLVSVTDPRVNLATSYSYQSAIVAGGVPLLTTVKPAGLAPYTLSYSPVSGTSTPFSSALTAVSRAGATAGAPSTILSTYRYALSVQTAGLADMSAAAVSVWGQAAAPTQAFAVFSQDMAPTLGATGTPTPAQLKAASVQYTDDNGYVINTASYGAGDWLITSTALDAGGRPVRELDAPAIAQIKTAVAAGNLVNTDSYATITRYNEEIRATEAITLAATETTPAVSIAKDAILTPAGTLVTDVWEPATEVTDENGTVRLARQHTHTDYDEGAPTRGINASTGSPFRLPTTVTVTESDASMVDAAATGEPVISKSRSEYDPIDGSSPTGKTSGWVLGAATKTIKVIAGGPDQVSQTRYNEQGWVVETRDPAASSSGTGAGVTRSSFYGVGSQSGADASCGGSARSAAWAGLACRTWKDDPSLPVEQVAMYSRYLAPATTTETRGDVVRTSSTTFDSAGRAIQSETTLAGVDGSAALPRTTTLYDPATGLVTGTSAASAGTISTIYDLWGRQTTYTDTDGAVTTTSYDAAGRVATVADPTGTTTYTYDGASERRGLVTSLNVSGVGEFTSTYDAAGNPVSSSLAGQLTLTNTYDRAGQRTALTYASDEGELAAWSMGYDIQGRVTVQEGPSAGTEGRMQLFAYDGADRLVSVKDVLDGMCTTRDYGFDHGGNRLSKTVKTFEGETCTGEAAVEARAWTFDGAERVQTGANGQGAYVYDVFGRQTSVPGVDTVAGADGGALSLGYFDNDLAHSITQGDAATTFALDAAQRRAAQTTVTASSTTIVQRHYTDSSDNPGWATTTTGGGDPVVSRYVSGINGDLAATVTGSRVTLDVVDPLGSIATTVTLDGATRTVEGLGVYDEYGNAITSGPSAGALSYGWLGGKERAADSSGLVLMGVRLYNSVTGLFTSVDPVEGGNETIYAYPNDPVNKLDLDGRKGWWSRNWKKVAVGVAVVAVAATCVFATAFCAGAVRAAVHATRVVRARVVLRAASRYVSGASARNSIRASPQVARIAGTMWVKKGGSRVVGQTARNGARWYQSGQYGYRTAASKGRFGTSSNLTIGVRGVNGQGRPAYKSFHISHR